MSRMSLNVGSMDSCSSWAQCAETFKGNVEEHNLIRKALEDINGTSTVTHVGHTHAVPFLQTW